MNQQAPKGGAPAHKTGTGGESAPQPNPKRRAGRARWPQLRPGPNPIVNEPWMERGSCTPENAGENWDPNRHTDPGRADEAKEFCASCNVSAACLQYAERNRVDDGVWGGKSFFKSSWGKAAA